MLADARQRHLPADLVLATGDLVHVPVPATYQRAFSLLASLGLPVYCLPGNHDERQMLESQIDGDLCRYVTHLHHGGWYFVFIDSTIPGSEGSHLSEERLQLLDALLSAAPDTHTLVCMHHQPVAMGSRWLDTMALDNPEPFFDVIDRHPQIRGILWGHVHQEFTGARNGVQLISTPSTCIQFMPHSSEFAVDMISPGYRWLLLQPDGRIETGVERLTDIPGTIDQTARGY